MERDKTVAELAGALLEIENHATSADNPKLEDWPKLFAELSARLAPSGNTRKDLRIPVQGEFTLKVDDREVVVQAQDVSHGGIGLRCAPGLLPRDGDAQLCNVRFAGRQFLQIIPCQVRWQDETDSDGKRRVGLVFDQELKTDWHGPFLAFYHKAYHSFLSQLAIQADIANVDLLPM